MSRIQIWGAAIAGLSVVILVWLLGPMLTPFLIGAALAYLCDPMVERLHKWKVPRTLAVLLVLFFVINIVVLFLVLIIPLMRHEFILINQRLPNAQLWVEQTAVPWLVNTVGLDESKISLSYLKETFSAHIPAAGNIIGMIVGKVGKSGLAIIGFVVNLLLVPVVFFFLLRDWPTIKNGVIAMSPEHIRRRFSPMMQECDSALSAFLRGQLMVMTSLAIFYTVGLWIVGLDIALLVGVFAGLASFIPYLGFGLGLVLAVIGALLQFADPTMAIWVIGVFVAGQLLEGIVLQPLLLGDRIGLHPVAVIFAVLAGGQLFGFIGVLLALPAAAVLLVLVKHGLRYYRESSFYRGPSSERSESTNEPSANVDSIKQVNVSIEAEPKGDIT